MNQPLNHYHLGNDQRIFVAPLVGGFLGGLLGSAITPRPFGYGYGFGAPVYPPYGYGSPYMYRPPFGYPYYPY
ncbi:hypothetical protein AM500_06635 [Bacillus sp. FJAT-18017]|uniref:hypothetical protein n=1 Tax=Bacillus sp. FJAT-18017 TaxID=1705566 RepID=UPI0006B00890|nr:hypothetical protein [Bacillus sp. FJAT-18017]ALC89497.1 hypothetical protein AM500_06635 [Bacillus sp. FJAT-18017]